MLLRYACQIAITSEIPDVIADFEASVPQSA